MPKAIMNNAIAGGNEEEAIRDGWYLKKPDGKFRVTQNALAAYRAASEKLERLHALAKDALEKGGDVEPGQFDAGIFEEFEKRPNWRAEFVALGGDPKAVNERTPKKPARRFRVYDPASEKPDGDRIAPTPDGQPLPKKEEKGE